MSNLKQIIRHRDNGMALQTISKTLGIARNTVKKYLQLIDSRGLSYDELLGKVTRNLRGCLLTPTKNQIKGTLRLSPSCPIWNQNSKEQV